MSAELITAPWLLLGVFVLVSYTVEAMTGFGSIVIAMSLGALVLPIPTLLPVLAPLNIFMSGYLSWRYRRHVDRDLLLRVILPLMGVGTISGYLLRPELDDTLLKPLFGLLVIWFALRALWQSTQSVPASPHPRWWTRLWIFGAGMTHGLFASGGPLLVYALAGVGLNKAGFRATLILVWFTLNSALTIAFAFDGTLQPALAHIALFVPVLLLGVFVGDHLHHRIDEFWFKRCIYGVLLIAGVALLWA